MTSRKTRTLASEGLGAGGEAAAARGGMMKVSGEEDFDKDDLLFDDELIIDEEDDTCMKGPVYPEGKTIRMKVGSLKRLLRKESCR